MEGKKEINRWKCGGMKRGRGEEGWMDVGVQTDPQPGGRDGEMEGGGGRLEEEKRPDELIRRRSGFLFSLLIIISSSRLRSSSDQSVTAREDEGMKRRPHSLSSNQFSSLSCQ